jgi:hypothetical protein
VFVNGRESDIRVSASVYQVAEFFRKMGPELGFQVIIVNTRAEKTPHWTTTTNIERGTTLPFFLLFRVLEHIVVLKKSELEERIILLTTILAIARGTSSVQAVRMESQATFLDDQDTLGILTESGVQVGIVKIARDDSESDASIHASYDDNDVVFPLSCILRSELEPLCLERLLAHCRWQEFEDPTLSIDLDNR